MQHPAGGSRARALVAVVGWLLACGCAAGQTTAPTNALPNPYHRVPNWAALPEGRAWGTTSAVYIDPDGKSVWMAERCASKATLSQFKPNNPFACDGSDLSPVLKFDASGKVVAAFGAGLSVFPHGIYVDNAGNVWMTDGLGRPGKGQQVIKFSPEGKILLTLGKAGIAGDGPDVFNAPSAVVTAPNGDIFVADGHGGPTNARIVKLDKDGKFIKTWGTPGHGPSQFDIPHTVALDTQGRLFVGDRNNNRIEIFDQDGKFIAEWRQFGRPSGIFIDNNDVMYVTDSESGTAIAKGQEAWIRGIRIGSARTGEVTAFIPDPPGQPLTSAAEGITVDAAGNIFTAANGPDGLRKYVRN